MADQLQRALELLPHGPAFRFVDRLLSMEPGHTATGEYRVRGDEHFLSGHFPGDPMFPGVLLLEAVAQLAGVAAQSDPLVPPLAGLKLTGLRAAKIFGTARPGEVITLQVEILGRLGNLVQARGTARLGSTDLLQAEIVLSGN